MSPQFLKPVLSSALSSWLLLAAAAQAQPPAAAPTPVPFEVLQRFEHSRLRQSEQLLLQNRAQFQDFWQRHAPAGTPLPEVDFREHWLLVILAGEKPTSGYGACLDSLQRDAQGLVVQMALTQPDRDAFLPQVQTSPGCLVQIPRQSLSQIRFLQPPDTASNERIPLPMRTLSHASNSLITEPRRVILRDAESFRLLWREHTGSTDKLPDVDFGQDMVIAVFMGEQPTGGYLIEIESLSESEKTLHIGVRINAPNEDQMVIQMLTAPAHLVAVPARELRIDFEDLPTRQK